MGKISAIVIKKPAAKASGAMKRPASVMLRPAAETPEVDDAEAEQQSGGMGRQDTKVTTEDGTE
eukprot:1377031-Alexandrium_andersonii.AAC.1